MKSPWMPLTLALVLGFAAGALFSPLRYTVVAAGNVPCAYRIDRLTGKLWFVSGSTWREVEQGKPVDASLFLNP